MDKKNELVQTLMDVEFYPPAELTKMNIDLAGAKKFEIAKAAELGIAFQPITQLINFANGGAGQSGMYFVNTGGKSMFKSGGDFIGSLKATSGGVGGGQARMMQLPMDPTMLCMAVAIMAIEKKLDAIIQAQQDILAFLEMKEEAKLKGNLNALADVLNNYKYNWHNEKYKDHKHILVQEIKRDAEQSIILYREQLTKHLSQKTGIQNDQAVKTSINKAINLFNDYQLALYTFSFSSFLEVMLLENFDSKYLASISGKVEEYSSDYDKLFNKANEKIGIATKSTIEGSVMRGLTKLTAGAGKFIEKIPVISNTQLDENLVKASQVIKGMNISRTEGVMHLLADSQTDYISPFIDNIKTIDILYNQPTQLMFDNENIYLA